MPSLAATKSDTFGRLVNSDVESDVFLTHCVKKRLGVRRQCLTAIPRPHSFSYLLNITIRQGEMNGTNYTF